MPLINRVGGGAAELQSKTVTPSADKQTVTPSSGYDGLSDVTVNPIPSTYVKPSATKSAATYTPGTRDQSIAAGTYCSGEQTIKGDADLVAANIKSGVSIFGVTGALELGLESDSVSVATVEYSPADTFYPSLLINPADSDIVTKHINEVPERIDILQNRNSYEAGMGIIYTSLLKITDTSMMAAMALSKDDAFEVHWDATPEWMAFGLNGGSVCIYSTNTSNERKAFNGTYVVTLYYKKTS